MTDAETKLKEFLEGLAVRACDVMKRECAVEEGRDHHVVLLLLAAGNVLLAGLEHPDSYGATRYMLPDLCELVRVEWLRRLNESDPTKN